MKTLFLTVLLLVAAAGVTRAAEAEALSSPAGPVILTVTGAISQTNSDGAAIFDRAMLSALEPISVKTFTPWTDGIQHFSGVSLASLLQKVGAEGDTLIARALNEYSAIMPLSDAKTFNVLLAMEWNGKAMTARDKGPVWIIFPLNGPATKALHPHNYKMVWQLRSLEVR